MKDLFRVGKYKFNSRLIVGTGKYKNFSETAKAIKASGADMVTVAVRRVNITNKKEPLLMDYINPKKIRYLPTQRPKTSPENRNNMGTEKTGQRNEQQKQ